MAIKTMIKEVLVKDPIREFCSNDARLKIISTMLLEHLHWDAAGDSFN